MDLNEKRRHKQVISLIEEALIRGQTQPWMYEVLALTMEVDGQPKADVERVLLSGVDFTAFDVDSMLFSAAYMARFGRNERALQLYRQASLLDPLRPEPYVLGLKLARQDKNIDAIEWAAAGILTRAWTKGHADLHQSAELAAAEAEAILRKSGPPERLKRFGQTLSEARQRDLVLKLTWAGNADLDLIVEEPLGTLCSFENPYSRGGGVLAHDGYGPKQDNTYELYLCPFGSVGDYRVTVRYVGGNVVAKQAQLTVTRYQGTPRETVKTIAIPIGREDKVYRITLHEGRRKDLAPAVSHASGVLPAPGRRQTLIQKLGGHTAEARREEAEFEGSRQRRKAQTPLRQAAAGFQPIIQAIPEGSMLDGAAIVSPDRRYVRLTMFPMFSAITDVFTFSFQNAGGAGANPGPATLRPGNGP